MKIVFLVLILSFTVAAPPAEAVKLWKWVDKDGKVTYSETPPPSQMKKSEVKHINPEQNVIETDAPPALPAFSDQGQAPPSNETGHRETAAGAGAAATTTLSEPLTPGVPPPSAPLLTPGVPPPPPPPLTPGVLLPPPGGH